MNSTDSPADPIRVLIANDDGPSRAALERSLAAEPDAQLVASVPAGHAAVESILAHRPDVVLLDIELPDRTGLDVMRAVGADAMPVTIVVTSSPEFAVEAFELAVTDYS